MIRLQDDPDDTALRARFDAWLDQSPLNPVAWADTERVSRVISAASNPARSNPTLHPAMGGSVHSLADERRRRFAMRHPGAQRIWTVSAVAAAACLALIAGPDLLLQMRADAIAGTGEVKTVHLADGSTVQLAPGAALAIQFAGDQRQVRLLRGNGYFDIRHDPEHPFRIATGATTTTVLGTAFEVRKHDAGATVAVRRGLVRVTCDRGPQSELLSVGQAADLQCGGESHRSTLEPDRIAAWTNGQFVATGKSLRDVIDGIRPWYRGVIVTRGAGIDRRRVTGVYDLRDPHSALDALAAAHQAQVRRITPWITVFTAD